MTKFTLCPCCKSIIAKQSQAVAHKGALYCSPVCMQDIEARRILEDKEATTFDAALSMAVDAFFNEAECVVTTDIMSEEVTALTRN